ncbi:MAG: hypothetical protein QOC81_3417 [Thermoanaerobaculia bacterium]|nr:hypothetical protein [Thermoanaerobaculia bacterium]
MYRVHQLAAGLLLHGLVLTTPAFAQLLQPVVTPSSITFAAGSSGQFVARTLSPPPPSLTFSPPIPAVILTTVVAPAAVMITPSQAQLTSTTYATGVTFTVLSSTPGTYSIPIRFQASGGVGESQPETVILTLRVTGFSPIIDAVAPPSVVVPSLAATFRVSGTNFAPGGVVISRTLGVVVERTTVFGPTLAEVVVRVLAGTPPGPVRLGFRNPDGGASERDGTLLVYPRGAIGAQLSVNTATIVFPVEGTIVSNGEAVYPRALLAMSGSGTVVGAWAVDGAPFDRFTATTNAGAPLEIHARLPIPPTSWGEHRLSLVIDSPQLSDGPSVRFESSVTSATRLTIYEPVERAVIEGPPRIRWTLVPGASAYEVEILHVAGDGREFRSRRFRTTETSWTPNDLGSGTMRTRLRAVFQGDTRGEPTDWRPFVVLPARVSLHIDGADDRSVAWSGGSLGMIYRVEFFRGESRCFSALSFSSPYRMATSIEWRNCDAVRVDAFSPSGRLLGKSQWITLGKTFAPPIAFVAAQNPADAIERLPRAGAISDGSTSVAARWRSGAQANSALLVDGTDVTAVAMRQPRAIVYEPLRPLAAGKHVAALASTGALNEWTFSVSDDQPPSTPAVVTPPPAYVLKPSATGVMRRADPAGDQFAGNISLSTQGAAGDVTAGNGTQATGDLVYSSFDRNQLASASPNWVTQGRRQYGRMWGSARVGYTTPDFTEGVEFLTSGAARTSIVARAGSPWGTLSYYQLLDPGVHGVLSGTTENFGVHGAAFTTPDRKPYVIRLIALRMQEPANVALNTTEINTRTFGIFGRYDFGAKGLLVAEAAHGSARPRAGSSQVSSSGDAFRLTGNSFVAGTTVSADVRTVDSCYVTPGNRGLVHGTGEQFVLGRTIGRNILNLTASRLEKGADPNSASQRSISDGIKLGVATTLNPHLSLVAGVGVNTDRADALVTSFLPATSRRTSSASATLSETVSKLTVSEALTWTRVDDHKNSQANNDLTSMTVTVNGTPVTNVVLTSLAVFTRTNATPTVGTTDTWLLSLTPAIAFPAHCLSVSPSITLDQTTNGVAMSNVRNKTFGSIVQWSPLWLSSLVSGQISATTTQMAAAKMRGTRTDTYTAAVTLHLNKTKGLPAFAGPPPLPGTQPPTPPADASSASKEAGTIK